MHNKSIFQQRVWYFALPVAVAVLLTLTVACGWYFTKGINLTITSNPPESTIFLDGAFAGRTNSEGRIVIKNVARGKHQITVNHPGFQPFMQICPIGRLAIRAKVDSVLQAQTYRVIVHTLPAQCQLFMDDKPVGTSDSQGQLILSSVSGGQHTFRAESLGASPATTRLMINSNYLIDLNLAQGIAELQNRKAADLLKAENMYRQGQFDAAIGSCDAVLSYLPQDKDALALQERVKKTKKIMGN